MEKALLISQVIISILLGFLILIQGKNEGFTASNHPGFTSVKRGPEKFIFSATVVLAALFLINALLFVFV